MKVIVHEPARPELAGSRQDLHERRAHVGRGLRIDVNVAVERDILGAHDRVVESHREILEALGEQEDLGGERAVVAAINGVDENGQEARGLRLIDEQSDNADEHPVIHDDVDPITRSRMVHAHFDGRLAQSGQEVSESPAEIGVCPPATGIRLAAVEQSIERRLARQGHVRAECYRRRQYAIQDDASSALRVAAQKMLGDACAVGDAVEVELRVAECLANAFEVANRRAGGEEARIVRKPVQAIPAQLDHPIDVSRFEEQPALAAFAGERRRPTGTALIDQDDVALADDAREGRLRRRVEGRCGLPRTARDDHERIRRSLLRKRVDHGDEKVNSLAARVTRIHRHRQRPALRVNFLPTADRGHLARGQRDLGALRARRGQTADKQPRCNPGVAHDHGTELTRRRSAHARSISASCRRRKSSP